MKTNKGISLPEIIVSISILVLMVSIVSPSLSKFRNVQILKNTTDDIVSLLNEARAKTLSSLNSNYYSVHIESNKVTLFTGNIFTANSDTNKVVLLSDLVTLSSNLNGGSSDIVFNRLTGETNQNGTLTISLISDNTKTKTININNLGIISRN